MTALVKVESALDRFGLSCQGIRKPPQLKLHVGGSASSFTHTASSRE